MLVPHFKPERRQKKIFLKIYSLLQFVAKNQMDVCVPNFNAIGHPVIERSKKLHGVLFLRQKRSR